MRVQRRPADDVLLRDGETAILVDGMAIRLSELGAMIFTLAENPVEVGALARELELRFGAPEGPSSREATDGIVAELIGQGVLTTSD